MSGINRGLTRGPIAVQVDVGHHLVMEDPATAERDSGARLRARLCELLEEHARTRNPALRERLSHEIARVTALLEDARGHKKRGG